MTTDQRPELSIVFATPEGDRDLGAALAALAVTLADEPHVELLLVGSGQPTPVTIPPAWTIRRYPTEAGMLVPDQWGVGLRGAEGELIAFLTPDVHLLPGWWPAVRGAIADRGVAGAAGAIDLAPPAAASAGVYLARYSAFLPLGDGQPVARLDLPGEATLYRRALLLEYPDLVRAGFWEVGFHRRLVADGRQLMFFPQALAIYSSKSRVVATMQQRWRHATLYGFERVSSRQVSRVTLLLRSPVVPLLLIARAVRRAVGSPAGRRALLRGLVPMALYSAAWASGEAVGGWRAARAPSAPGDAA